MWHITSSPLAKEFLAVFLTGLVIKLTDDFIDREYDILLGRQNFTNVLGAGILPYAIVIFSLACLLEPQTSISLFFSSYIIGMTAEYSTKMPSGLYGYQESLIMLSLGILVLGYIEMFSSLFIMWTIQLWDDLYDYKKEIACSKNCVKLLGKVECLLSSIIFFLFALYLDAAKAIVVSLLAILIVYIINILSTSKEVL